MHIFIIYYHICVQNIKHTSEFNGLILIFFFFFADTITIFFLRVKQLNHLLLVSIHTTTTIQILITAVRREVNNKKK